ncbi:MAG: dihydroorotase [Phycisphaerales bacterium]
MTTTLIANARVIDPSQGLDAARHVLVDGGVIKALPPTTQTPVADRVIDARGCVVAPGFIDLHVHLREPGGEASETIRTGTRAAALGGFTTVFCMPNTNPVCDNPITVKYILDRAADAGPTRVAPVAAVTTGQQGELLTDFAALREAGAGALSDDGRPVIASELMRRAMEHAASLGIVILDHCEDMSLTGEGVMHEGPTALRLGLRGIPRASEAACVARDCLLSLLTGCRLHICHVSNIESVEAIRHFKKRGAPVTAEVSPHHLTMTEVAVAGVAGGGGVTGRGAYDTHAKMKPPLCEESDRLALIEALEDGTLDCIATDHAPHSPASKATTFEVAPFGIIGMETAFPVLCDAFVKTGRWTLPFLVDKLACAPARLMGDTPQTKGRGTLAPGAPADVVMLREGEAWRFDEARLGSKSRNCPWLGSTFHAGVVGTMADGKWSLEPPATMRA